MRAQVVLVADDRILLAGHRREDHIYWVLPGGAVEPGETPEGAAVREVREETGLEVEIEQLLFVDGPRSEGEVVIKRPRYTFLARVVSGDLCVVEDRAGEREGKGYLVGCRWMPFASAAYDAATRDTLRLVRQALDAGEEEERDELRGDGG